MKFPAGVVRQNRRCLSQNLPPADIIEVRQVDRFGEASQRVSENRPLTDFEP